MIKNIKSLYIIETILKYISKRDTLNIFKYNKFYKSKFGFTKNDCLFEFCYKIPDLKKLIEEVNWFENNKEVINLFKSLEKDILNKNKLKENIIEYFASKRRLLLIYKSYIF